MYFLVYLNEGMEVNRNNFSDQYSDNGGIYVLWHEAHFFHNNNNDNKVA